MRQYDLPRPEISAGPPATICRVTGADVQVAVHQHQVAHVALVIEETPALVSHLQARDLSDSVTDMLEGCITVAGPSSMNP